MRPPLPPLTYQPVGHFVLRAPILPGSTLDGLAAAAKQSLTEGRRFLGELIRRPDVYEALYVASPTLLESLPLWEKDPESDRGQKVERALMSYVQRLCSRCTPFGLFASVSLGRVTRSTRLQLPPIEQAVRKTRLDMGFLFSLSEQLMQRPEVRARVRFFPNETVLRVGERLHYVTATTDKGTRLYALSAVDALAVVTDHLFPFAEVGRTPAELAQVVKSSVEDVDEETATGFVQQLIDVQLLVPELSPVVTGAEAVDELVEQLARIPEAAEVAERLTSARTQARALDEGGLGQDVSRYAKIDETLKPLGVSVAAGKLLQVDLGRLGEGLELSEGAVREALRVAELVAACAPSGESSLETFRTEFSRRYEGAEVPLLEALDEEVGAGFLGAASGQSAPLLKDLRFPPIPEARVRSDAGWNQFARGVLQRARAAGSEEVELTEKELDERRRREPRFPESMTLMLRLLGPNAQRVELEGISGPSSEPMLGRFAWLSPSIEAAVRAGLQAEAALRPETRFVELVHAPEGRQGNVIARPAVRDLDLPILTRSGLPRAQQLKLSDLTLSEQGGRLVLRSKSLGCEVVPRLTNAHNATAFGLPLYRFLFGLQGQDRNAPGWSWGALESADWLPRVRVGRVIVSLQRWLLSREVWGDVKTVEAAQDLAQRLRVPRFVLVVDFDNLLPVDFENPLSVRAFLDLTGSRERDVEVTEDLARSLGSASGDRPHELHVPMVASRRRFPALESTAGQSRRVHAPTTDWLFARIDVAPALADRLLLELITPLVESVRKEGNIRRWFFIRYSDQGHHLRLRFQGEPKALEGVVLRTLGEQLQPWVDARTVDRWSVQTYQPELARYGGPAAMELCEAWFEADSDATLELVGLYPGDTGLTERGWWAFAGVEQLLSTLLPDLEVRQNTLDGWRSSLFQENQGEKGLETSLSTQARARARALETLLSGKPPPELEPGLPAHQRRGERLAPLAAELHKLAQAGQLTKSLGDVAGALMHMHCNRLLRADQRRQELVIYDGLSRRLSSLRARSRTKGG